jgi:hypothetical protein
MSGMPLKMPGGQLAIQKGKTMAVERDFLAEVSTAVQAKPTSCVAYGPPGIGKTSFGAAFPGCIFLIDDQEDGLSALKVSNLINVDTPVLPPAKTWENVTGIVDKLRTGKHDYKVLVIDTIGGLERLLHTYVCDKEFGGNWGETGFASYNKGYQVSLPHWRGFLASLDQLRNERNMGIVMLAHSVVRPFHNPEGEDFDRYALDMHLKTWSITHKWADVILFLNFHTIVTKDTNKRQKGKGGTTRIMHTEHSATFDAKNRHALPPTIDMGFSGTEAYSNFISAITEARQQNKGK